MKHVLLRNLTLMFTLTVAAFLYSCQDEDTDPTYDLPTVSTSPTSAEVYAGDAAEVTLTIAAAGGFDRLEIYEDGAFFVEKTASDIGVTDGDTSSFDLLLSLEIDETASVGDEFVYTFMVIDSESQESAPAQFTITVSSPEAKVQTAIFLYAPTDDEDSKTFYSIADNLTYSVNEVEATDGASSTIDLGYFFISEANLASPSDYSDAFTGAYDISDWTTHRTTLMVATTLTSNDVVELTTVADIEDALADVDFDVNGESTMEGLTVGSVYAFQTEDGLEGLLVVSSLQEGYDKGDYIELEFILASAE